MDEVILALDFGTKRVGLAISHGIMAAAIGSIEFDRSNSDQFFDSVKSIIDKDKITKIIIGHPIDEKYSDQRRLVEKIAGEIKDRTELEVELWDESFSSVEAKENNAKDIDSESAKIILQRYLDES